MIEMTRQAEIRQENTRGVFVPQITTELRIHNAGNRVSAAGLIYHE
jgi:hypothetical protein